MPVSTDTLNEDLRDLTRSVGDLRAEFSEFRGEIRANMRVIRWAGVVGVTTLLGIVAAGFGITWQASALNSKVVQFDARFNETDRAIAKVEFGLRDLQDKFQSNTRALDRLGIRLDALEKKADATTEAINKLADAVAKLTPLPTPKAE